MPSFIDSKKLRSKAVNTIFCRCPTTFEGTSRRYPNNQLEFLTPITRWIQTPTIVSALGPLHFCVISFGDLGRAQKQHD